MVYCISFEDKRLDTSGGRPTARTSGASSGSPASGIRSEEHTSELQSPCNLVCRLLLEKKKIKQTAQLRAEVGIDQSIAAYSIVKPMLIHPPKSHLLVGVNINEPETSVHPVPCA